MKQEEKNTSNVTTMVCQLILLTGLVIAFVKVPEILADKISYKLIKKRHIKQEFEEKENE